MCAGTFNLSNFYTYFVKTEAATTNTFPTLCPEWQDAGNTAVSHGETVAYPAAHLTVQCLPYAANGYTCAEQSSALGSDGITVNNFWSTNAVDTELDQPMARLLLNVAMLDLANQTMTIGELIGQTVYVENSVTCILVVKGQACTSP